VADDDGFSVQIDMGLDHREFFRLRPAAVEERAWRVEDERIIIEDGDRRIDIELDESVMRPVGPTLKMPMTVVRLHFSGYRRSEAEAFLERFRQHYQRGGG
jgi:hypothetical protein